MRDKKLVILFFVFLALGATILLDPAKRKTKTPVVSTSVKLYGVAKIHVLTGHEFDLTLKNGNRIRGELSVRTPIEAVQKVVELMHESSNPEVALLEKRDDHTWQVELYMEKDNRKFALSEWLKMNNLIWH
jgi:hypothetical protein